ncbi:hypothetical protein PGTUg99_026151 [Puccinia graminis f. sp. tritici]|uniref:Uncharacterized protein n=2 Tax=Puccinia graminis f. sp. tritici TaxID=56615 RepID=A0A5B0SLQ5_PUCGR|nr:hypothetical protein PGTUg99_026151 [Puccinia graminis f. sp. tritici]
MKLCSILCTLHILHFYVISAHPALHPKYLAKRDVKDFALENQVQLLHKRMEGSSRAPQDAEYVLREGKYLYDDFKSIRKKMEDTKLAIRKNEMNTLDCSLNLNIMSSNIDYVEQKYKKPDSGEGSSKRPA